MTWCKHNLLGILFGALFCAPLPSHATIIQILHTNDLHASLKTAGAPKPGEIELGGWAQLKAKMDDLESDAAKQGIKTLRLDAGDFTEGTLEYFPDNGVHVLKAFQDMGFQATTLGNHDWLMGATDLNNLWGASPFKFPVLSANTEIHSGLKYLKDQIKPTTQFTIDGVKIGIFGLSTHEALYSWIPKIKSYKKSFKLLRYEDSTAYDENTNEPHLEIGIANQTIEKLKNDGNDVVIALTHIGYGSDISLAAASKNLDLIIGGHSHTFLDSLNLVLNQEDEDVPVVQAGFNGQYIGKIWLEVVPGKKPRVLTYELVSVPNSYRKDETVEKDVIEAEAALTKQYGNRLDEPLGTTTGRLMSSELGPTAFSRFAVDAMREIAETDTAVDIGSFHGNTAQPSGIITRRSLMEMYPRKFEAEQTEGLYIYRANIPGLLITLGIRYALKYGSFVSFSGVTYDVEKLDNIEFAKLRNKVAGTSDEGSITPYYPVNIRLNGQPIKPLHWYSMAAPESFIRGAFGLTPMVKLILLHPHPTSHTLWDAMNFSLLRTGNIPSLTESDIPNLATIDQSNEKYASRPRPNPFEKGEGIQMPWVNSFGTSESVILDRTLQDVSQAMFLKSVNPKINLETN